MIDILIPSRGRPDRLVQTIASAVAKCANPNNFNVYIYLDSSDDLYPYLENINKKYLYLIGLEENLSQCWNRLYRLGEGEILFHGSDDIIFETKDWDLKVINHFKNHPETLYYGRDGHQDSNCPTHSFTSRIAADKIGYFVPPYFEADWNDVWLREVYEGKKFYDESLFIRHNHVNVNPSFDDETYELARTRRQRAAKVWEEKKHLILEDRKRL